MRKRATVPLLSSHRYAKDCVCPVCAGHRSDRKLAVINDFISWANAPLLAGMRRASEREKIEGVDVPVAVLRAAGLPLKKLPADITSMRLLGHART
jgi:hypothetical protein